MRAFESEPGHPHPREQRNVYDARMEGMQAGSTNAKLDALGEKIDALSQSIDKRFEQVDQRFMRFEERFEIRLARLDSRIDRLQYSLVVGAISVIVAQGVFH